MWYFIDRAAEALAAHVADGPLAPLLPRVDPHVVLQRAGVAAALAAGLAHVRLLPRVGQHVVLQRAAVAAALAADLAGEELLAAVFAQVTAEDAGVAGAQAQHVAAVVLQAVGHPVGGEGRRREEALAAHLADEVSVPRVQVLVGGQALPALEGLRAERADERRLQGAAPVPLQLQRPVELTLAERAGAGAGFLQAVPAHVPGQGVLVSKLDPAVGAFVGLLPGVASGVRDEPLLLGKTLAALGAEVRFGVGQVVSVQHALQSKGFVTGRTLQRLRALLFCNLGRAGFPPDAIFFAQIRVAFLCGCIR